MGWRFRKSFKILPGIRLNFGKRGFTSATIGKKWTSLNIGKRGVTNNFNVPGTGLSYRTTPKPLMSGASDRNVSKGGWAGVIIVGGILFFISAICCAGIGSISTSPSISNAGPQVSPSVQTLMATPTPAVRTLKGNKNRANSNTFSSYVVSPTPHVKPVPLSTSPS